MPLIVSVLALIVALVALGVTVVGRRGSTGRTPADRPVPADVETLRDEVEALRAEGAQSFRRLAVVRYDAFGDTGGHLSWSVALLDDVGDGVVLTSIHGRSDSRTYAKNITSWSCDQQLSPEEEEAIGAAKSGDL